MDFIIIDLFTMMKETSKFGFRQQQIHLNFVVELDSLVHQIVVVAVVVVDHLDRQ